jgi:hypothetical protein
VRKEGDFSSLRRLCKKRDFSTLPVSKTMVLFFTLQCFLFHFILRFIVAGRQGWGKEKMRDSEGDNECNSRTKQNKKTI